MKDLVITLSQEDMMELQAVLIDKDESRALQFVETCLAAKIPQKGSAACDSSRKNPYLLKPEE